MATRTPETTTTWAASGDARGIVYVEFVFAFMPLLVMFLSICQLAMITMGRLVVQHAALCGARAAIVVLEDDPKDYADAPRGNLKDGEPLSLKFGEVLDRFGLQGASSALQSLGVPGIAGDRNNDRSDEQRGARMVPIRAASTMPLLLLAPNEAAVTKAGADSVAGSLPDDFVSRLPFSLEYMSKAAVITVHTAPGTEQLASEHIPYTAQITVRVTYLMPCGLPVASTLMCQTLSSLLGDSIDSKKRNLFDSAESPFARRLRHASGAAGLRHLVSATARFVVLTGETTLPNQGAGYEHPQGS